MKGIIPAYAGSTLFISSPSSDGLGSSPHTRGARIASITLSNGTSDHPRIRGEHRFLVLLQVALLGIIPAYAGSTVMPLGVSASMSGSSPHTRGAPDSSVSPNPDTRDHPRIRGEHSLALPVDDSCLGIIPAYAGSTPCAAPSGGIKRIIPAYAGSTTSARPTSRSSRDHPRIRGEHGVA